MDKVFLDANVIFSAAYRGDSRLCELWRLGGVQLTSCPYAIEEASRNVALARPEALEQLGELLAALCISSDASEEMIQGLDLDEKDRPVLASAIQARASHFLTGDRTHFGHLLGNKVEGVLILSPAAYFEPLGVKD
jgi:uncharacterized protein